MDCPVGQEMDDAAAMLAATRSRLVRWSLPLHRKEGGCDLRHLPLKERKTNDTTGMN